MILENVEVQFAQLTGDGNENDQYLLGVTLDKKMIKVVTKERDKVWDKLNTGARDTPSQSFDDWCGEDEESGKTFLWLGCDANPDNPSHALDYIVGEGDSFTMKDFARIGHGSKVTVEFNMYLTRKGKKGKKGENIGRSMLAVQLLDLVPFEGGATPTTLKGTKLNADGTKGAKGNEDKKKKKDKKKKNK